MADDGVLTLNADLAAGLRGAARDLGYATPEAVVREAFDAWFMAKVEANIGHERLNAMIQEGLDDIAAGRVVDFDVEEIIREARDRRAARCG